MYVLPESGLDIVSLFLGAAVWRCMGGLWCAGGVASVEEEVIGGGGEATGAGGRKEYLFADLCPPWGRAWVGATAGV